MELKVFDPSLQLDSVNEMEFLDLAKFGSGGIGAFWSSADDDRSPWEMHPDCDELLHVMEGKIEVEVLPSKGGESSTTIIPAGSFIVIPQGCWHRQRILEKTREFYLTPGPTRHSFFDDPRLEG